MKKTFTGIQPRHTLAEVPFFKTMEYKSVKPALPMFPFKQPVVVCQDGSKKKIWGILDGKHGKKRSAIQARQASHDIEMGYTHVHTSASLKHGCPVKGWLGSNLQSDKQCFQFLCAAFLVNNWACFGYWVMSLVITMTYAPWECDGTFSREQILSNALASYYILLLCLQHVMDEYGDKWQAHFSR